MKKLMNKGRIFRILSPILIASILGSGFFFGFYFGTKEAPKPPQELPSDADLSILWDVWRKIEQNYVGEVDYQKMIYGAAKGLADGLGDPYTVFYDPKESDFFREDILGAFEGVGMEMGMKENVLTVVSPLEGTPAKNSGVMAGDQIIKIGDIFSRDITIDEAIKLIRGPKGTEVKLLIFRKGWKEPKEFKIIRDIINIPSLKLQFTNDNIAHFTIYQFNENIILQFEKAAQKIIESKTDKIILDLRNNPGGLLNKAQEIAGWFLGKGLIVLIEDFSDNEGQEKEYKAKGNAKFSNYKIVVLINQGTASAAEILAAALKENRSDVKLIGERTFGKGSVQEALEVKGGSLLKITVARWFTPKRKIIEKMGIQPDIEVKMTEKDLEGGKDPQLERAIEVLNQK